MDKRTSRDTEDGKWAIYSMLSASRPNARFDWNKLTPGDLIVPEAAPAGFIRRKVGDRGGDRDGDRDAITFRPGGGGEELIRST